MQRASGAANLRDSARETTLTHLNPPQLVDLLDHHRRRVSETRKIIALLGQMPPGEREASVSELQKWQVRLRQEMEIIHRLELRLETV